MYKSRQQVTYRKEQGRDLPITKKIESSLAFICHAQN